VPQFAHELNLGPGLDQAADERRVVFFGRVQPDDQLVVHRLRVFDKRERAQIPGQLGAWALEVKDHLPPIQAAAQIGGRVHRDQPGFEDADALTEAVGLVEVRVVARLPYEATQLEALLGTRDRSGGCGSQHEVEAAALAGKVWSATFSARKPGGATGLSIRSAEAADLPTILALLEEARLPTAGVAEHLAEFLVAEEAARIAGAVGMERAGEVALFRSLVVRPDARRRGIAERLFRGLETVARAKGVRRAYLLTETLEARCRAWGFTRVPRETVPEALRASPEFTGCCPSSAALMAKDL